MTKEEYERTNNRAPINNDRFRDLVEPPKKNYNKYIIIGGIILIFALFVVNNFPKIELPKEKTEKRESTSPVTEEKIPVYDNEPSASQQAETKPYKEVKVLEENGDRLGEPYNKKTDDKELSTLELLERRQHEDVVRQAKRAGVSTEGSTIEILERIQHADVVKQAKRAGVSAEGSTIEILERIQHVDIIKQAKRAGVSTEGSTIEILERIQRKELEKYNY